MEKLKMQTPSMVNENFEKLSALFPNAVTEAIDKNGVVVRAIDADVLRQEINIHVVEGREERYQFTWPDKKKAVRLANSPIAATLRPCRKESVDFNNTENLYIEGDNLDVLKLLRETYLNKIKMIYIDPPYNTGNDFIYEDDFAEDVVEFLQRDHQYDEDGNRMVRNLDSNGRFHTDWLNMIYPRLRVARDLLKDDGVIFISIDDGEINNLRKICDEIFGAGNFVAQVIVQTNPRGRTFDRFIAKTHEYLVIYTKNIESNALREIPKDDKAIAGYQKEDIDGKYRLLELRNRNPVFHRSNRPLMFFPFYADPNKMDVSLTPTDRHTVEIYPRNSQGEDGCWTWGLEKATNEIHLLVANLAKTGKWSVFRKDYLEGTSLYTKAKGLWLEKEMNHENGKEAVGQLFGRTPFDFPKSVEYIKKCLLLGTSQNGNDIVLDFFSGSATTAHAVMQLNAEEKLQDLSYKLQDGKPLETSDLELVTKSGNRKFIMVQLPEVCDEKSEAAKAGYTNICEIGKERIRRAGAKIVESYKLQESSYKLQESSLVTCNSKLVTDIGFRVLKLDSSNMEDVYYTPQEMLSEDGKLRINLDGFVDNIKKDRTDEDLLFQVMLDLGIPLSSKIQQRVIGGAVAFFVASDMDNYLVACFQPVTDEIVTEIAQSKPYYAVFRDSSFASDATLVNFEQIFKTYSPTTEKRVL